MLAVGFACGNRGHPEHIPKPASFVLVSLVLAVRLAPLHTIRPRGGGHRHRKTKTGFTSCLAHVDQGAIGNRIGPRIACRRKSRCRRGIRSGWLVSWCCYFQNCWVPRFRAPYLPCRPGVRVHCCFPLYFLSSSPWRLEHPGHRDSQQGRSRARSPPGTGRRGACSAEGPCGVTDLGEGRQQVGDGLKRWKALSMRQGRLSRQSSDAKTRTGWQQSVPCQRKP